MLMILKQMKIKMTPTRYNVKPEYIFVNSRRDKDCFTLWFFGSSAVSSFGYGKLRRNRTVAAVVMKNRTK